MPTKAQLQQINQNLENEIITLRLSYCGYDVAVTSYTADIAQLNKALYDREERIQELESEKAALKAEIVDRAEKHRLALERVRKLELEKYHVCQRCNTKEREEVPVERLMGGIITSMRHEELCKSAYEFILPEFIRKGSLPFDRLRLVKELRNRSTEHGGDRAGLLECKNALDEVLENFTEFSRKYDPILVSSHKAQELDPRYVTWRDLMLLVQDVNPEHKGVHQTELELLACRVREFMIDKKK